MPWIGPASTFRCERFCASSVCPESVTCGGDHHTIIPALTLHRRSAPTEPLHCIYNLDVHHMRLVQGDGEVRWIPEGSRASAGLHQGARPPKVWGDPRDPQPVDAVRCPPGERHGDGGSPTTMCHGEMYPETLAAAS